jgi:hypothetical protein
LRIGVAEAAVPAQGGQTLLVGREPAILAAEARIIRAPRIILCFRGRAGSSYRHDSRQHEKQNSHGRSPDVTLVLDYDPIQLNRIIIRNLRLSMILSENRFQLFGIMLQGINTEPAKLFRQAPLAAAAHILPWPRLMVWRMIGAVT